MNLFRKLVCGACALVLCIGGMAVTASAEDSTVLGVGFVSADSLRLRSEADIRSATLTTAPENDCVVILEDCGDWYKVNYNLTIGYMHKSYLSLIMCENAELGRGTITGSDVNLRSAPNTTGSVVAVTKKDSTCSILGINNGWYKVQYDGNIGYIRSDYVALTEIPYENQSSPNTPQFYRHGKSIGAAPTVTTLSSASSDVPKGSGNDILSEARKYLGCPYVYGGASPSGFDCSGFVYYVLKQQGYSPYRTPADQIRMGVTVSRSELQPGDIVFFFGTSSGSISHTGIYAGSGQFIHAPNSGTVVSYSSLTSGYWLEHYYGACRVS